MRRAAVCLVLVGIALLPVPAGAQGAETSVVVSTEAEYRAALTTLSADTSGPHTVTLGANITITGGVDPVYSGTQPLTIDGAGFIIDGGGTRRALRVGDAQLTMHDIRVENGFTLGSGGAVETTGPVHLERVEMFGNDAGGGGGALSADGAVTIVDSELSSNTVTNVAVGQGGAVHAGPNLITATRSTFRYNVVVAGLNGSGGAMRSHSEGMVLTDVVALGNSVESGAGGSGGAFGTSGPVTLTRGQVYDNVATGVTSASGGGISAGELTIVDAAVVYNTLESDGDTYGSGVSGTGVDLSNVTIAENVATGDQEYGAVYTGATVTGEHATIVDNEGGTFANLVANTLDGDGFVIGRPTGGGANCSLGAPTTATDSVDDDGTCGFAVDPTNLSDVADIGLGPIRYNGDLLTHEDLPVDDTGSLFPLAGSPVIDLVSAGSCLLDHDVRGVGRPFGAGCDAGAVEAVFPAHLFTDVGAWVEDAVRWLRHEDLMVGITDTQFRPDAPITRAQVVRMLYRLMGEPDPTAYSPHPFTDVPGWVENAVRWAFGEGIVTGETPTTFVPNDPITRAQVVRMVYRTAGSPDVTGLPAYPFTDVPGWVDEAVTWAADTGNPLPLITGITPTTFVPEASITRGQVARMTWRLGITPPAWADPESAPSVLPFRANIF